MANQDQDHWSSEAYQNAASFVPKLATKVMQWLDPQENDSILDIGCGDGVLDVQIGKAAPKGTHVGVDSSQTMIEAARKAMKDAGVENFHFAVCDARRLDSLGLPQTARYTKVFSNAALHWILGGAQTTEGARAEFFRAARDALVPGGTFAFELGGLGNVAEMRTALLMAVARRVGLPRAAAHDPWFFPDEAWVTAMLEETVGGWAVERVEREWRPTAADPGGIEGWVRLMGARFFEAVPEGEERELCIREVVEALEVVCRNPNGGFTIGYVRLRVLARKTSHE
ncbi:S-adenosyl-L-methionine-dependent methyltransferase [Xylariomycetidae sp. FL0641]|nr:S-adenosyl-L-methionine-dependent methyltransferase [Xylariomycetidae sp. FL0641]